VMISCDNSLICYINLIYINSTSRWIQIIGTCRRNFVCYRRWRSCDRSISYCASTYATGCQTQCSGCGCGCGCCRNFYRTSSRCRKLDISSGAVTTTIHLQYFAVTCAIYSSVAIKHRYIFARRCSDCKTSWCNGICIVSISKIIGWQTDVCAFCVWCFF